MYFDKLSSTRSIPTCRLLHLVQLLFTLRQLLCLLLQLLPQFPQPGPMFRQLHHRVVLGSGKLVRLAAIIGCLQEE